MAKKKKVEFPQLSGEVSLVDSHCHLDMDDYHGEIGAVLDRAASLGVRRVVSIGIDIKSSAAAVEIAAREQGVAATAGVHPHYVEGLGRADIAALADIAAAPEVVAIGEIGMDMVRSRVDADTQARGFADQMGLARDLSLPVIIHDREAHEQVFAILDRFAPFRYGGVMHCFSGDPELARRSIALGFYISIPGVVTFPRAGTLVEVVREMPLERMLLETDGPYLSPVPLRGRRNEPGHMLFTAAMVAKIKGVDLACVARETTKNVVDLLRLENVDERRP